MRVVIVGAGVAGLATAWMIRQEAARRARDVAITVLEAGPRPGGRIRTTEEDGYLIEWAANGIQGTDGAAWRLAEAVGLADERVIARPDAARRYIAHGGRLHLLPLSPAALFGFRAISPWARLRVALEPFYARRVAREESVHDYAARHIGEQASRVLIGSAVRGIFAGDAKRLSVDAAFPLMRRMERDHRSLVVAMMKRRKQGGGGPGGRALWSLRHGIESLTGALARSLGAAVRTGAPALTLSRGGEWSGGGVYTLRLASGERIPADAVVLATPARAAAALLRELDPELARRVGTIEPAGLAVVGLAMKPESFRAAPDGYGYLVSPDEPLDILGALFESNLFPGRAPEGRVLVRVMIGGAERPELVTRSDADLIGLAMRALDKTHGLASGPERTWVIRQEAAISQYPVGHVALLQELDRGTAALPGLHLTGNPYRGVSVASLIEDAERTATRVLGANGG
ncbi:MAG TPA: protoporphyrinogen oxidase [Candidatus Eisenbacteria bacterium]